MGKNQRNNYKYETSTSAKTENECGWTSEAFSPGQSSLEDCKSTGKGDPVKSGSDSRRWLTGATHGPQKKDNVQVIAAYSKPGDIVLDSFCGSGTTGLAAKVCGRRFALIEKNWRHYRTAQERLNRGRLK
jgi:hypothetical protein